MERDEKMRMQPPPPGEAIAWRDPGFAPQLFSYDHIQEVSKIAALSDGVQNQPRSQSCLFPGGIALVQSDY
jgi:hypothetical protein